MLSEADLSFSLFFIVTRIIIGTRTSTTLNILSCFIRILTFTTPALATLLFLLQLPTFSPPIEFK